MKKVSSSKSLLKDDNFKNNKELITRDEIKDSPFIIIGTEGKYFGTIGKYRITEPRETKKEVEEELKEITWNRIVQIVLLLNEITEKQLNDIIK